MEKKLTFLSEKPLEMKVDDKSVELTLDVSRLTNNTIKKIIEDNNIWFDVKALYVSWETETPKRLSNRTATVYKHSLFIFEKDENGKFVRTKKIVKSRTI